MSEIILVLGGARSGKSSFAEEIAHSLGEEDVIYLATAEIRDGEMGDRISKHRMSRPPEWETIEESKNVDQALSNVKDRSVVLLDCLTVFISNLLLDGLDLDESDYDFVAGDKEEEIVDELERIIEVVKRKNLTLIVVSNEVGQGLVPLYKLGRIYRDIVGRANQLLARDASEVYITFAGLPVEIKELGERTLKATHRRFNYEIDYDTRNGV